MDVHSFGYREDRLTKNTVGISPSTRSEYKDKAEIMHAPTSGCLDNETPILS